MTRLVFRMLAFAVASAIFATTAAAQTTSTDDWLLMQHMKSRKIYIVTAADPAKRERCRIKAENEKSITCSRAFGHSMTYQRQDVEAVIASGAKVNASWWSLVGVGIFGSIGYGLYALGGVGVGGLVAACAIALPASLAFLLFLAVAFYGADGELRQPDAVIYIKPGTTYKGMHAAEKKNAPQPPSNETPSAAQLLPNAS